MPDTRYHFFNMHFSSLRRKAPLFNTLTICTIERFTDRFWKNRSREEFVYTFFGSILTTFVPQVEHLPTSALRLFLRISSWASAISTFFRHFIQYPSSAMINTYVVKFRFVDYLKSPLSCFFVQTFILRLLDSHSAGNLLYIHKAVLKFWYVPHSGFHFSASVLSLNFDIEVFSP